MIHRLKQWQTRAATALVRAYNQIRGVLFRQANLDKKQLNSVHLDQQSSPLQFYEYLHSNTTDRPAVSRFWDWMPEAYASHVTHCPGPYTTDNGQTAGMTSVISALTEKDLEDLSTRIEQELYQIGKSLDVFRDSPLDKPSSPSAIVYPADPNLH